MAVNGPSGIFFETFSRLERQKPLPYTRMVTRNLPSLTSAQAEVLSFIKERCRESGIPPSYREIQKHFGYKAVGTVQDHVKALIAKGALEKPTKKSSRKARTLLPAGHSGSPGIKRIPVYGEVAAGGPREAQQLELGTAVIDEATARGDVFALRVVGDSMIDVGIYEGDLLVVEKRSRARSGDIVVALLDNETTVKRYEEKGSDVFLIPENKKMGPISTRGKQLSIQGKVVGLQRKF
jgi:repressor LexA